MAVTQDDVVKKGDIKPFKFNLKPVFIGMLTLLVIMATARWYQHWAAWD